MLLCHLDVTHQLSLFRLSDRWFQWICAWPTRPGAIHAAFAQFRSIRQDALDNAPVLQKHLSMPVLAVALTVVVAYAAFWCAVCALVATRPWGSTAHATALMGCWAVLTLCIAGVRRFHLAEHAG